MSISFICLLTGLWYLYYVYRNKDLLNILYISLKVSTDSLTQPPERESGNGNKNRCHKSQNLNILFWNCFVTKTN